MSYATLSTKTNGVSVNGLELYETPAGCVHALLNAVPYFDQPRRIYEPACGPGAIVAALATRGHDVFASDLGGYADRWKVPHQGAIWGLDFLDVRAGDLPACDAIVTNPPFSKAAAFAVHALTLVPDVFMLMRLAFTEGGDRCPHRDRLMDSGDLVGVYPFRERVTMHRDNYTGKRAEQGALAFSWFHWRRGARAVHFQGRRLSVTGANFK